MKKNKQQYKYATFNKTRDYHTVGRKNPEHAKRLE